MALTLVEQRKTFANPVREQIVEAFVQASRVLDFVPVQPTPGNAYSYNEEATLPGVEFRAVNAGYAESTGTLNQKTESWSILGGRAFVDRALIQTSIGTDQVDRQTERKLLASAFKFQDAFINGDVAVDANSFDGLKKRLTGAQVIDAATNGLAVVGADDNARHSFFDILDTAIAAVSGPDTEKVMFMNDLILARIQSSARRLGISFEDREAFENGPRVSSYRGIPIMDIGTKADGTRIIPQTEIQGASTVASSIYIVKPTRLLETEPGVIILGFGDQGAPDVLPPVATTNPPGVEIVTEWYPGMAVFGKGAARLRGVLNS